MDPITARAALRLAPTTVVTPELVEAAYRDAVAARHPAGYAQAADRAAAEAWAATLATARARLLAEATGQWPGAPAVDAPSRPRRMGTGAIVAISVAATLVVAGLGAAAGFAAASFPRQANASSASGPDAAAEGEGDRPPVEQLSADETGFSFPAALEAYFDGRYDEECPAEFEFGCWQTAIITDSDCDTVEVELAFSSSESGGPERTERRTLHSVVRGLPQPVVFGDDEHEYGWINDVVCVTAES